MSGDRFKVRVANNFDEALKLIAEEKPKDMLSSNLLSIKKSAKKPGSSNQAQDYVEELLGYIEQINWEFGGTNQIEEKDPDHPFRPVFDAINLIKWELELQLQQAQKMEAR